MRISSIAVMVLLAFAPSGVMAQSQEDERTIASFLEEYPGNEFSDFITILKKADLWTKLENPNYYQACFAPSNAAIRQYLLERKEAENDPYRKRLFFDNVESLPDSITDSIARTHISDKILDLPVDSGAYRDEAFPNLLGEIMLYNQLPRYGESSIDYIRTINQRTIITDINIPLANGYVHIVDGVIRENNTLLPGYLKENNTRADNSHKATIFYNALKLTGLSDTLMLYQDFSYPTPEFDSTYACLELTGRVAVEYATPYESFSNGQQQRVIWPERRYFKYTLFVVTDSILQSVYGIRSVDDLRAKAISVYPEGASLPDTDRNSSLNKLISYHILPCWLNRNMLNYTDEYIIRNYKNACPDSIDMQDFYETMHPYAIMRISTPYDQLSRNNGKNVYINRKGTVTAGNLEAEGIRIWNWDETYEINTQDALNGGYYYVDSLLLFDRHTKNALNTRIRVMFSTLSPDFINSGARGRMRQTYGDRPTSFVVYSFKNGYCKNVSWSPETFMGVRYLDKYWDILYHDELALRGHADITFRLPPVPESGIYEIRVTSNAQSEERSRKMRGTVLYYTGKEPKDLIPDGTPVDLTIFPEDSRIGYISDRKITGDTYQEIEQNILANDMLMRSHGYMKYPDSFAMGSQISDRLRNHDVLFRRIVTEMYMEAGKDYYLRIRQMDGPDSMIPLNFLEIVPYSIYSGENGPEDRH